MVFKLQGQENCKKLNSSKFHVIPWICFDQKNQCQGKHINQQINDNKNMIYIKINHITANIPYQQCKLRFLLKSYNSEDLESQLCQVKLLQRAVSLDLQQSLKVTSSLMNSHDQPIMLCVLVVSKQRNAVVHIGYILIDPFQAVEKQKAPLKGVSDQTGYVIFSVIHSNLKQIKQEQQCQTKVQKKRKVDKSESDTKKRDLQEQQVDNIKKTAKQVIQKEVRMCLEETPCLQKQIKKQENRRQRYQTCNNMVNVMIEPEIDKQNKEKEQYNQLGSQKESENEVIQRLRRQIERMKCQTETYKRQIDQRVQKYELTIELLRQELLNQSYLTALRENEIFQMKNKGRIQKLVRLK